MQKALVLFAALCAVAPAADDAVLAPQRGALVASANRGVVSSLDAITIPQMVSYQGRLTDTLGVPVPNGNYQLTFRLYTQPTGGTAFWSEAQTTLVRGGLFSALLGAVAPVTSVPDAGALYLSLQVAADPELAPRLRLASAAYAYLAQRAANSDLLQGRDTATFSRSTHNHDATYVNEAQADAITSGMIVNGAVAAADLNQMGASSGQVMKWTGSAWAPRNDSLGTSDNAWARVGADSVLYTIRRLGIAKGGAGNVLYGESTHTHVNLGVACTTGTSGQNYGYATVGGGWENAASSFSATVGGGYRCGALGQYATVAGGAVNKASTLNSTVAGGGANQATGQNSAVGGGYGNAATGYSATIPGGYQCVASGLMSFAAGTYAKARGVGSFVWSDSCGATDSVRITADNCWVARARGGVCFYTNLGKTTGSWLASGGSSWNAVSDSMTKENFRPVDRKALLEALARMRVRDYNLKSQDPSIRHIGPVAQDFHSAFGYGESNTAINMEDADGVLLAAVQALCEQNQVLNRRVSELEAQLRDE